MTKHSLDASNFVAWGEVSSEQLDQLVAKSAHANATFVIIPTSELIAHAWSSCPVELMRLVENPVRSSIVACQNDQVSAYENEDDLWKAIVECPANQIRVADSLLSQESHSLPPELAPRRGSLPNWLGSHIQKLALPQTNSSVELTALKAGVLQMHDELHASHSHSQSIEGEGVHVNGDYWHGIMHRREPDYGNSKYWFRRVGDHPIFSELSSQAEAILKQLDDPQEEVWINKLCSGGWDPFAFVDLAQECGRDESTELAVAAREIQWAEMILLLIQTYQDAVAES